MTQECFVPWVLVRRGESKVEGSFNGRALSASHFGKTWDLMFCWYSGWNIGPTSIVAGTFGAYCLQYQTPGFSVLPVLKVEKLLLLRQTEATALQ